jgi:hypothetical protein
MTIHSHTKNQVNISIHSKIKWWQLNIWPNFIVQARAITRPKIIEPERNVNLICNSSLYTHTLKIKSICPSIAKKNGDNDIDLIFGMRVYSHKLQIKFEIRSVLMMFGHLTVVGLWNLAKYLVVTTLFHYDLRYWLDFW